MENAAFVDELLDMDFQQELIKVKWISFVHYF